MSQLNIRTDYYQPGVQHLCRFCSTPIARLKDGVLRALHNKVHVVCLLETGTIHRFNCCGQCAKRVDFKANGALQQVWDKDCEVWKNMEVMEGEEQDKAEARMEQLKSAKVVSDFCFVEKELKDAKRGEKLAKQRLKKLQRD